MNQTVKNILLFYAIAMFLLLVSSLGVYIISSNIGAIFASITLTIIPLITLSTVILAMIKAEKWVFLIIYHHVQQKY